jgi:carboxypeptidase Taq
MSTKLERLKVLLGEVEDLHNIASLLGWDQNTYMPPGGSAARGQQLATLDEIAHQRATSGEVGDLLKELKAEVAGAGPDSDEAALVRVATRDYEKAVRVPPEFVVEQALVATAAFQAWTEARAKSDFSIFLPHLEKVLALAKRYISFFPPAEHPYDVLLDDYEPGMKTAEVREIFDFLRPRQVELIRAIGQQPQVADKFLSRKYDERKVWDFAAEITRDFGYDWNRGRMDKAPHPFETSLNVDDVRITNRFEAAHPLATLFSAMHEAGHAMYEQGVDPRYERTPLARGASLAVHESQSRMWENLVGRSQAFWEFKFPSLKKGFSAQLDGVGARSFYRGVNKVERSLIRVNADEATYNLHIMLRLELEIGMVEGVVAPKDLPAIWDAKMRDYLGIEPPDARHGVLQDVHWSYGSIGYFSTYALGNLISVQLWEKMQADLGDLEEHIRAGEFKPLLAWLRKNIHRHGRKFDPQDLMIRATGSKISPEPYIRYLTKKYSEIYKLQ